MRLSMRELPIELPNFLSLGKIEFSPSIKYPIFPISTIEELIIFVELAEAHGSMICAYHNSISSVSQPILIYKMLIMDLFFQF